MNKDQKAAVIDEVAAQINDADAIIAVDYRGLSVTQAVELRSRLAQAEATFRVVKNRLTVRAADKAGAESLKEVLEGPTAFAFVSGDAAVAAKALATFRREHGVPDFKGGTLDGERLTVDQIESISRLPARDVLHGQFVGVLASPITGLVRGLGSLISGLAIQLGQIQEQGLIGDGGAGGEAAGTEAGDEPTAENSAPSPGDDGKPSESPPEADESSPGSGESPPQAEAPGDPVSEAETAEEAPAREGDAASPPNE